jgi:hypothetical protein
LRLEEDCLVFTAAGAQFVGSRKLESGETVSARILDMQIVPIAGPGRIPGIFLAWARLILSSLGSPRSGERKLAANTAGDLLPAAQTESDKKIERAKRFGVTNRRVGANILGDTGSGADLAVELVLVDTVGTGGFSDMTGTTGKHELVGDTVLLRIEQV